MADLGYVYSRLTESVRTLATGAGTIRVRLQLAFNSFITLSESNFPDGLRAEFRSLMSHVTPEGQEGEIAANIETMTEAEAHDIAETILELQAGVRNELERTAPDEPTEV